jgi:hypothetical protein
MAKARYNSGVEVLELTVLKENKNGTLELSADGENLKIGQCPIDSTDGDNIAVGSCRRIQEAAAAPKADDAPEAAKADKPAGKGK